MFAFTIPGEPTGKGRPKFTTVSGFAKAYTPEKTARYENWVKCCFLEKYPIGSFELNTEKPVQMDIAICMGIPQSASKKKKDEMLYGKIRPTKKPDADNILKLIADSLNKIAYSDDKQIVIARIQKFYSDNPRVAVLIKEV